METVGTRSAGPACLRAWALSGRPAPSDVWTAFGGQRGLQSVGQEGRLLTSLAVVSRDGIQYRAAEASGDRERTGRWILRIFSRKTVPGTLLPGGPCDEPGWAHSVNPENTDETHGKTADGETSAAGRPARRGVSWPRPWRQGAASDQHFPLRGRGENQKHIEPGRDRGDGGSEKVVSPWHR